MSWRNRFAIVFVCSTAALAAGCAHGDLDHRIDEKLAKEPEANRAALQKETAQVIKTAPGLTDEQRAKLEALRKSMRAEADQLRAQSLKLRAVLIADVISPNFDEDEVELIKRRMKALEDQRLSAIFGAVDQANTILGH